MRVGSGKNGCGNGASRAHGLSRRALRRHLQRQLRGAILKHLKRSGVVPPEALLTTKIQTATLGSRFLLGFIGVIVGAGGGGLCFSGEVLAVVLGGCLVALGAVMVTAGIRGRKRTVREYLGKIWDSAQRETESRLDDLVANCLEKKGGLEASTLLDGLDIHAPGVTLSDMSSAVEQLGDSISASTPVDIDLGDTAGSMADSILDGVFSGL